MQDLYIGLMSGTSLDGVDGVLEAVRVVDPELVVMEPREGVGTMRRRAGPRAGR